MSTILAELHAAVARIATSVGPAVAGLGRGWGSGSGVVVASGLVLTNAHNLRGDEVAVTIGGRDPVTATVAGLDADLDVAVLKVDTGDVAPVRWDTADTVSVTHGLPVVALADPGGRGLRVTPGFVSATGRAFQGPRGRRVTGSIEHTAPLPRGSSGGPLVDLEGRLLAINTVRVEGGLILALPADAALRHKVDELAAGRSTSRPRLGLALAPPKAAKRMREAVGLPDRAGLLVRGVQEASPAADAGIQRGDLLIELAGRPITTVDELFSALESSDPGATIPLRVVRGLEEREVDVTFDAERTR